MPSFLEKYVVVCTSSSVNEDIAWGKGNLSGFVVVCCHDVWIVDRLGDQDAKWGAPHY